MVDRSLSPHHVTEDEKPLRREVAMAYRTAREVGRSHHEALDAAEAIYAQGRPEAMAHENCRQSWKATDCLIIRF